MNQTTHDWPLEAIIEGSGFFGPTTLIAKASMTSYYPLMFRPHYEAEVDVSRSHESNGVVVQQIWRNGER